MSERARRVLRAARVAAVVLIVAVVVLAAWAFCDRRAVAHHERLELAPAATPSPGDGDVVLAG